MTEKQFEVQYDGWRYFHVADTINERCIARLDTKGDADAFLEFVKFYEELSEENEELKQQLSDCKKDEKQLSISFMEFKMQLIKVLQQNYNYAYNQRQKNLDKSIVARNYEVLYQTIDNIAETMNVDIERFPKGDDE